MRALPEAEKTPGSLPSSSGQTKPPPPVPTRRPGSRAKRSCLLAFVCGARELLRGGFAAAPVRLREEAAAAQTGGEQKFPLGAELLPVGRSCCLPAPR